MAQVCNHLPAALTLPPPPPPRPHAPAGVGAWVARRADIAAARKAYWGGGSVFLATARLDWRLLRPAGAERFEDGTLPFLNILALRQG